MTMSNAYLIKRSFHFYAAHRNDDLPKERCFSIHGHTYFLDCHFLLEKPEDRSYSVLFSEIERRVITVIDPFEHSLIINRNDPFFKILEPTGTKLCVLEFTPSAENVAKLLFERIKEATKLNLVQVDLRETTTSVVSYRG
jgi:6-pyruvoyl-tetrahydropterin synthase